MKVTVTGATGFIGRYIVHHLVERGHDCRCWYRPGGDRGGFEDVVNNVEWVAGELAGGQESAFVDGCDAVVHSALYHPGGTFRGGEGDVAEFVEKNVLGTIRLIEAARTVGVERFVFLSTCAVHERGGREVHAADVARAAGLLLTADARAITGEAFNCCDRYISEHDVATLAKQLSGSSSRIQGGQTRPKHQIVTDKLQAIGMQFGGDALFEKTIGKLVDAVR